MIEYRSAGPNDYDQIRELLVGSGWEKRVADESRFLRMMESASRTIVAVKDESVIGFARALCDGVSNGYIGTVAVAEQHRRRGIGREMIKRLMGDDPNITWVLRAGRGSEAFWSSMGFSRSRVAMERNRAT